MTITFRCPNCQTVRNAPDPLEGRRVRCPGCDGLITVVALPPGDFPERADLASEDLASEDSEWSAEPDGDSGESQAGESGGPESGGPESGGPESGGPESGGTGTVHLVVDEPASGDTVMLEAVSPRADRRGSTDAASGTRFSAQPPRAATSARQDTESEDEAVPELRKTEKVEAEMDMTPMIDATFQLLIFFMITAAFALQKSKEIPKPKSDEPSSNVVVQDDEETANAVIVQIDENNSFLVINADGDEEEAPSVLDLHSKLRKAHDGDSEGRVPTVLRVEAHGEALHGRVITAIDAGNDAGFAEVQLASLEEDA